MTRPHISCRCCEGTGTRELGALHWETLRQISNEWVSTDAIESAHQPRIRRTTLIERLNALVGQGLAERQQNKRRRGLEWRRVDP